LCPKNARSQVLPGRSFSHGESDAPKDGQRPEGLCIDGPQDGFQDQVWQACRQKARGARARGAKALARMGVRDFYMDQCCDAVVVTEVTEDTVIALCDYGS
jgi:hypothetical protein